MVVSDWTAAADLTMDGWLRFTGSRSTRGRAVGAVAATPWPAGAVDQPPTDTCGLIP
jgi:hypothetical protein